MRDAKKSGPGRSGLPFFIVMAAAGAATAQPPASMLTTLHSFAISDGEGPRGKLVLLGGKLYGTTYQGGSHGGNGCNSTCGVIFSVDVNTGAEQVVYDFAGNSTGGTDGANPASALLDDNGILYGTTTQGGAGAGTVFSFDPATGIETVLYKFAGGADGFSPWSALTIGNGALFGTTLQGGSANLGTVFRIDLASGVESIVYSFKGNPDGAQPYTPVAFHKGFLYGATEFGGASNDGAAYRVDPVANKETVLHSFAGASDGTYPFSGLLYAGGLFYGTTLAGGGSSNGGCLYSLNPSTGALNVLYGFKGGATDGSGPEDSLLDVKGTLYGTTSGGGPDNAGTIYSLALARQAETVLHSFTGKDGSQPLSGLIVHKNIFYGTTFGEPGTVYKFVP